MKRFLIGFMAWASVMVGLAVTWAAGISATVTWTAPVAYSDNTVMPASAIDHYTVSWSRTPTGPVVGSMDVKTLQAVVPVACGTVQFSVTATTNASAVYPNTTSAPAGPVPYVTGVACAPNPPLALAVH